MTQRFPFEKMWSFQSVEHQIAAELSYFNWYQVIQELQKAFNAFAALLQKILYDTSDDRIEINPEKANKFLELYFGNGKESNDTIERGLYALDIVQREFEGRYAVLCRGYNEEISPASHHQMTMIFYKKMYPLVWELWHRIADQIEMKSSGLAQIVKWLKERADVMTEEELEAEEDRMVKAGEMIRLKPAEELMATPLGGDEE
ncbi:MAG: hypothetical protein ACE5I5_20385 [Candidatus Heimdallarchaeota archaeon]